MTTFTDIDQTPTGQHMFTLYLTDAPVGTPQSEVWIEEVDVTADRRSSLPDIIAAAKGALSDYPEHVRVIGVIDQSRGVVVAQKHDGNLRNLA